jgi:hypothetical protein
MLTQMCGAWRRKTMRRRRKSRLKRRRKSSRRRRRKRRRRRTRRRTRRFGSSACSQQPPHLVGEQLLQEGDELDGVVLVGLGQVDVLEVQHQALGVARPQHAVHHAARQAGSFRTITRPRSEHDLP